MQPSASDAATDAPPSGDAPAPAVTEALEYRPALDGLRAVAVYLVVAFHAGSGRLIGGFIGVDTFFVLSGYLVTRVILTDLLRGSFAMVSFYGRRVRRLLPAAIATLVLVAVAWLLLASPVDRRAILGDARSAALYFSNWHFAQQATDYFAANQNPTPLLHFWSLSVEEQFYFVWPLTVYCLWRLRKGVRDSALKLIGIVAAVASSASVVALVLTVRAGNTSLAYYGTHTRAYQLLGGALLAVLVQQGALRRPLVRRLAVPLQVVALAALVFVATSAVTLGPSKRGMATAVVTLLLLAALEARPTGAGARVLGFAPFTYLGKISYGTYLWHYPVIIVVARFATMSPYVLALVATLLATGLAALSSELLEMPIRTSRTLGRHSRAVVAAGLATSVLAGVVVIPAILRNDRLPAITVAGDRGAQGGLPAVSMDGFDLASAATIPAGSPSLGPEPVDQTCTTVPVDQCIITHGSGKKLLLIGDSHAAMLIPAFRAIGTQYDLTVAVAAKSGCPWQQTLYFTLAGPGCDAAQKVWYDTVIPDFDPDIIVFASRATDHAVGAAYAVASTDPDLPSDMSSLMVAAAERTLRSLARPGRTMVLEEPVPVFSQNTTSCLSGVRTSSECSFTTEGVSPAEVGYRALATKIEGLHTLDLDRMVCPALPICDPIIDGILVRADHDHITKAWAAHIADQIGAALHDQGIV